MRNIDGYGIGGRTYSILQDGNKFYIFRKEKEGNVKQLNVVFNSAEDAKKWVMDVLYPAWLQWAECNKVVGEVYLYETKKLTKNMKQKQTLKLNESQLRNIIKNVLRESLDIDNILSDLTDNADDYDLAGVEFTDEDAQRVITLMQENGLSYDDALSQVLSEIQDVISQGYEDFDEDDYINEAIKKSIKKVLKNFHKDGVS